jgi:hypothetical protein
VGLNVISLSRGSFSPSSRAKRVGILSFSSSTEKRGQLSLSVRHPERRVGVCAGRRICSLVSLEQNGKQLNRVRIHLIPNPSPEGEGSRGAQRGLILSKSARQSEGERGVE